MFAQDNFAICPLFAGRLAQILQTQTYFIEETRRFGSAAKTI